MKKTTAMKRKNRAYIDENPVEARRDNIASGVVKSFTNDLVKPGAKDLWEQLLGVGDYEPSKQGLQLAGDLPEGGELDIASLEQQLEKAAPAIEYHREVVRGSEIIAKENTFVLQRRIGEVILELRKLAKSSQELQIAFRQVSVEATPINPGRYHLNFLEWILSVVRSARLKVEESKTWLALFTSKKAKRAYWAMFKKHGTTFGLSHERVVATQTG